MNKISTYLQNIFMGLADKHLLAQLILVACFVLSLSVSTSHAQVGQLPYAGHAEHRVQQPSVNFGDQQPLSRQVLYPNQVPYFNQTGFNNANGFVQPNGSYNYPARLSPNAYQQPNGAGGYSASQSFGGYREPFISMYMNPACQRNPNVTAFIRHRKVLVAIENPLRSNSYSAPQYFDVYQSGVPAYADQIYRSNVTLPLGGLFAKDFTRTLTLLGGFNFTNALASPSDRFDPEVGVSFFDSVFEEPQTGYAISFAFGRRHSYVLRSEIEIAVRGNDLNTSGAVGVLDRNNLVVPTSTSSSSDEEERVNAYSVMKNFIHDFRNNSRYTPYLGFGIGWSYLDVESTLDGIDDGAGAFTYQAIGGVAATVSRVVDLIVEYRFLGTSEVELDDFGSTIAYETHNLFFGLKYEY